MNCSGEVANFQAPPPVSNDTPQSSENDFSLSLLKESLGSLLGGLATFIISMGGCACFCRCYRAKHGHYFTLGASRREPLTPAPDSGLGRESQQSHVRGPDGDTLEREDQTEEYADA